MAYSNKQGDAAGLGATAQLLQWFREIPGVVWLASVENRIGGEKVGSQSRELRAEVWCLFQRSLVLSQIPEGDRGKNET